MDKAFHPTIEGVQMVVYDGDDLVLLRGDKENFTFDGIARFEPSTPIYRKLYEGLTIYKFVDAIVSVTAVDDQWTATGHVQIS